MKPQNPGPQPPKSKTPPPVDKLKGGAVAVLNPKLGDQRRKRLGQHYASKYQTMRRG